MNIFFWIKNEKLRDNLEVVWLAILLIIVLTFADFGSGFQYAGF